jgi:hypothetical protein
MTPTSKDFAQMRELTRMTGQLNNVQAHQLKMWTHVILSANTGVIEFDAENCALVIEISNLDYKSMMEGVAEDMVTHFNKRLQFFNKSAKLLLGEEFAVIIKMRDRILGDFPPSAPPQKSNKNWSRIFQEQSGVKK